MVHAFGEAGKANESTTNEPPSDALAIFFAHQFKKQNFPTKVVGILAWISPTLDEKCVHDTNMISLKFCRFVADSTRWYKVTIAWQRIAMVVWSCTLQWCKLSSGKHTLQQLSSNFSESFECYLSEGRKSRSQDIGSATRGPCDWEGDQPLTSDWSPWLQLQKTWANLPQIPCECQAVFWNIDANRYTAHFVSKQVVASSPPVDLRW